MIGLVLLAAAGLPASSTLPSPCIGLSIRECVANVEQNTSSKALGLDEDLASWDAVDVNGRKINHQNSLHVTMDRGTDLTGRRSLGSFWMTLKTDPSRKVRGLSVSVDNLLDAKTQEQYDDSGLVGAMSAAFDPECWGKDKLRLYRWFNNSVKPTSRVLVNSRSATAKKFVMRSATVTFCGRKVSYMFKFEQDRRYMDIHNVEGVSSYGELTIE